MDPRRMTVGILLAGVVLLPVCARAAGDAGDPALAKTQIQETSQKVLNLFKDPVLIKPENTDRLLTDLHAILDERFDWPSMARWVLATNRPLFSDAQVDEFAKLFGDYVVLYYLTQVEPYITGGGSEQVRTEYRDGKVRTDGSLSLEVLFITPKGTQVLTGYTMVYENGPRVWRVRNFLVEGISLVRNWRTELAPVKSREKIMDLLKGKIVELREKRVSGAGKQ